MKVLGFEFLAMVVGFGTIFAAQSGRPLPMVIAGGFAAMTMALIAVSASIQADRT